MDNLFSSLDEIDQSDFSEEDIAVIKAFEAMDNWPGSLVKADISQFSDPTIIAPVAHFTSVNDDEMFMIFIAEAEEDIASMVQILKHMEPEDNINPALFMRLQRLGHKVRGTSGAVDFPVMSIVASYVEAIAEQISKEKIYPFVGVYALSKTVSALERVLREITTCGKEPEGEMVLTMLDVTYRNLNIDVQVGLEKISKHRYRIANQELYVNITNLQEEIEVSEELQEEIEVSEELQEEIEVSEELQEEIEVSEELQEEIEVSSCITAPLSLENMLAAPRHAHENTQINIKRFEKLTQHLEQLVEFRTVLEDAREEVEKSLQELQTSQMRLQHLEPMLSLFLTNSSFPQRVGEPPASSLIARIINEAMQRRSPFFRKSRLQQRTVTTRTVTAWDELDIEQYSEKDLLLRSLKEAIADVSLTTARVQAAHAHLAQVQQEYISRVAAVRSATLQMRHAPLSILVPRLRRVIKLSALGQTQEVRFDVMGESTEIDQDILEVLAFSLVQLLRTCIADIIPNVDTIEQEKKEAPHIWLHIRETGNEIVIEIGFSMTVHGGAIDAIRDSLQRLNGKISLQRNADDGISFFLHIPRLQGAMRCLLVRANLQKLVIPFSQIWRIVDRQLETLDRIYHLRDLLGFPPPAPVAAILVGHSQSVLVMQETELGHIGIAVDEIIGEIELFLKPLKSYLQRPGIMGTAIDGKGSVTLTLDLPVLVKHYMHATSLENSWQIKQDTGRSNPATKQIRVLVADDAVYLRHSVRQTLQHANYTVIEARDGMEAIEKLQEHVPEVCVLDIEMPNLNGYDVLNMVQQVPELKNMKVVMLTSRSSEKHRLHAIELGAHAYLTKPCSQETLLTTIQQLYASS